MKLFCIDCHRTFEDQTITEKQVIRGKQIEVTRVKTALEFAELHGLQNPKTEKTIPKHHDIFRCDEQGNVL